MILIFFTISFFLHSFFLKILEQDITAQDQDATFLRQPTQTSFHLDQIFNGFTKDFRHNIAIPCL